MGIGEQKKPVMFEARAMAQGNRCMNYTVGIGYPSFTIKISTTSTPIAQSTDPVVSAEGSTPLNIQNVQNTRHDIGINTPILRVLNGSDQKLHNG